MVHHDFSPHGYLRPAGQSSQVSFWLDTYDDDLMWSRFRSGEVGVGAARSWCAWYILRTLRNVAIIGDDKARGAVSDATTNVLLEMLPRIAQFVKKFLGDTEGANIRTWMVEIWG